MIEIFTEPTPKKQFTSYQIDGDSSIIYQSIKNKRLDQFKLLMEDQALVNAPILTMGPFAGYTPLHLACVENNEELVKLLIQEYNADVNVVAEDGTQPIHLASLHQHIDIVKMLLSAHANVDAEMTEDIYLKFVEGKWCSDFGEKMTLLTMAVLEHDSELAVLLIENNANRKIKSLTNSTLLMYTAYYNLHQIAASILRGLNDTGFINARDDDGIPATHYVLHPKKYSNSRYGVFPNFDNWPCPSNLSIMLLFYRAGADMHALINNDPDTFLINIASYRSSRSLLTGLLPRYFYINHSKALYFATIPFEDTYHYFPSPEVAEPDYNPRLRLERQRQDCKELIIKDLINRQTFGIPVPDEEKQLLYKLIATDAEIKNIVVNYEKNFIGGVLKNLVIPYGNKSITRFDFMVRSVKNINLLVKDKTLVNAWHKNLPICWYYDRSYQWFKSYFISRNSRACRRFELLVQLKKVSHLRKVIPLPYECILDMIEYLNNPDLEIFIKAFIK